MKYLILLLIYFLAGPLFAGEDCRWSGKEVKQVELKSCTLCSGTVTCSGKNGEYQTIAYCKKKPGQKECPSATECMKDKSVSLEKPSPSDLPSDTGTGGNSIAK